MNILPDLPASEEYKSIHDRAKDCACDTNIEIETSLYQSHLTTHSFTSRLLNAKYQFRISHQYDSKHRREYSNYLKLREFFAEGDIAYNSCNDRRGVV